MEVGQTKKGRIYMKRAKAIQRPTFKPDDQDFIIALRMDPNGVLNSARCTVWVKTGKNGHTQIGLIDKISL